MSLADRYHPTKYSSRYIHFASCVSSMDTLAAAFDEIYDRGYGIPTSKRRRIRNEEEAKNMLKLLNTPGDLTAVLNIKGVNSDWPKFDYIRSNLVGYIFYFVCTGCNKRVKFLYHTPSSYGYLCRDCLRLTYPKKKKHEYNVEGE